MSKQKIGLAIVLVLAISLAATYLLWPAAKFEVSSIEVTPSQVFVGEDATISVEIKNVGNAHGTYKATLLVNNIEVETKDVSLSEKEAKTITFIVTMDADGDYTIRIGEQTDTLVVNRRGMCPILNMGDEWIVKHTCPDIVYTITKKIVAMETVNGIECYKLNTSFTPPYLGYISVTSWLDRQTLGWGWVKYQFFGERLYMGVSSITSVTGSSYYPDAMPWPLEVGKQWIRVVTMNISYTELGETTTTTKTETKVETIIYEVEAIEEISVPAGTFTSFKIVGYSEYGKTIGQPLEIFWFSDRPKCYVKSISFEIGWKFHEEPTDTFELVSYNLVNG